MTTGPIWENSMLIHLARNTPKETQPHFPSASTYFWLWWYVLSFWDYELENPWGVVKRTNELIFLKIPVQGSLFSVITIHVYKVSFIQLKTFAQMYLNMHSHISLSYTSQAKCFNSLDIKQVFISYMKKHPTPTTQILYK